MHAVTATTERFAFASIQHFSLSALPKAAQPPLGVVDGLVSVTRCSWAEPFDTGGSFAA
ncbi:MAG: hypothetical protein U1F41_02475 [Burkholderiales bacterium]